MRRGKTAFDDTLRFPANADEALLATVTLRHPEKRSTLRAELWLANGRLFSLLFSSPPKDFGGRADAIATKPVVAEVSIHLDPMKPVRPDRVTDSSLHGWVKEWFEDGLIRDLYAPLPEPERIRKLVGLNTVLTSHYLEFVSQTEGATYASSVTVHGLAGVRKVVGPDENAYVLAEDVASSTLLAAHEGAQYPELHFSHHDLKRCRVSR
jgi:hypothetical protein